MSEILSNESKADLPQRLRMYGTLDRKEDGKSDADGFCLLYEAADEIDALRERAEAAEQARDNLRHFVTMTTDGSRSRIRKLEEALEDACRNMERTRRILQDGFRQAGWSEDDIRRCANWGMLDTAEARKALAHQSETGQDA